MPTPLLRLHMKFVLPWLCAAAALAQSPPTAPVTVTSPDQPAVRAEMTADRPAVQAGQPVWVRLTLTNMTGQAVTLAPPNTTLAAKTPTDDQDPPIGLPLAHVFSGPQYTAVSVKDERGDEWDAQIALPPRGPVPAIRLAAYGCVGLRLDLAQYYSSLKHPGKYTLVWRPYGGTVVSAPLALTVLAERQAVIATEQGSMTVRFYYDQAPLAVENFIDLAGHQFYDRLTFHKIVPHGWILGGDPTGTGKGGRLDGKRIKAEFNSIPFEPGTVAMARLPNDPDSASSQFFITATRQPALNGTQTAFGYLADAKSMRTLEKLMALPADETGHALQPIVIKSIRLESVPTRESSNPTGEVKTPTTRPAIIPDTPGGSTGSGSGGSATPTPATRPAEDGDGQQAPEDAHEGQ